MFRFFRKRGKEEESGGEELSLADLPGWLGQSEQETDARLEEETRSHRARVKTGIEEIRRLVAGLPGMAREEAYHPKLEKIARNTLPLFVKSMQTSLGKEVPDDPDEFYAAAGECLKGSVKAAAGPGRYLQAVFPAEMKAIRAATDTVGREVNAMTPAIREARRRRELISRAHATAKELGEYAKDLASAEGNLPALRLSIDRAKEELVRLEGEIAAPGSPEQAAELERLSGVFRETGGRMETRLREFKALRTTAVHVLRKTEKISSRREGTKLAKELHRTVALLEGEDVPDEQELLAGLSAVMPAVTGLLQEGETELKNKEEKNLFSAPDTFIRAVKEFYEAYWREKREFEEARAAYSVHPLVVRRDRLNHDRAAVVRRIAGDETALETLQERVRAIHEAIPALSTRLAGEVREIAGKPVEIGGIP